MELSSGQSFEHDAAHADVDLGLGVIGSLLVIAGEAAGLVEPTEGALEDPTLAHEWEAFGVVAAAGDVEVQFAAGAQPFDPLDQGPGVAAIGPDDWQFAQEEVEAQRAGRRRRPGPGRRRKSRRGRGSGPGCPRADGACVRPSSCPHRSRRGGRPARPL